MGLRNVGLDDVVVHEEQADPDVEKHKIHPVAKPHRLLVGFPHGLHGSVLVSDLSEELRLLQEGLANRGDYYVLGILNVLNFFEIFEIKVLNMLPH